MELRVKELCKERGIKMSELAEKMGVNQANLASSLNGNPTLSRLKDVAKVLDVEIYELFVNPTEYGKNINGYVEICGEIVKISSENDWLNAAGKIETLTEPYLYTRFSDLRKDIRNYVHDMVKNYDSSRLLCGRLGRHELFTLACSEEMIPDIDGEQVQDLTFSLSLVRKQQVIHYSTVEYGIDHCDLDGEAGLIKTLINDLEWPLESMESCEEFWD